MYIHLDWPWSIAFIGQGDTTDRADVIENTEHVNRTCNADCNPYCTYTWINNTDNKTVSNEATIDLGTPDRYDAGNYTCIAGNVHGKLEKVLVLDIRCKLATRINIHY